MEAITKVLDAPIPRDSHARRVMVYASAMTAIGLFAVGFRAARQHGARLDAAAEKPAVQAAIDKATVFGRCVIDETGRIITWNHGMTRLLGWTSREMVGGDASRLDPRDGDDKMTFAAVWSRRETPWFARGRIHLRAKDGSIVERTVTIRDLAGPPLYRELSFDPPEAKE